MPINYDKKWGTFTDTESGLIVARRGWLDTGDGTFSFCDPSVEAKTEKDRWFHFWFDFIFEEPTSPTPNYRRKVLGMRIYGIQGIRTRYYKDDADKYQKAERHIVAALKNYITVTDGLPNPRIEICPDS